MDPLDIHDPAEEAANRELLENPEPLTFPFGETPEEVIRERHEWLLTPDGIGFIGDIDIDIRSAACVLPTDDLLTVLDALQLTGSLATIQANLIEKSGAETARQLRISILAALGIKEG